MKENAEKHIHSKRLQQKSCLHCVFLVIVKLYCMFVFFLQKAQIGLSQNNKSTLINNTSRIKCICLFFTALFQVAHGSNRKTENNKQWSGYQFICVMLDYMKKWPQAHALRSKTAAEVTDCIIQFFHQFEAPKRILTNQDFEFVFQSMYQLVLFSLICTFVPAS